MFWHAHQCRAPAAGACRDRRRSAARDDRVGGARCSCFVLSIPIAFVDPSARAARRGCCHPGRVSFIGPLRTPTTPTEFFAIRGLVGSVVVGGVEGGDDVGRDGERRPRSTGRGGPRPTARPPRARRRGGSVGAELGVAQVEPDAPGEAPSLRPRLGVRRRPGHRARRPSPRRARTRRGGVVLADVVQQRGGDPPRVVGVRACRRDAPARRGRRRSRGAGRGSAGGGTAAKPSGVSTVSTHATSSARAARRARARRTKRPDEVHELRRHPNDEPDEPVLERPQELRDQPVKNTSRNSTRNPYGRNLYQCGSQLPGQHPLDQRRPVERRDRQQVEEPEEQVDEREREQDPDAERQVDDREARRHRRGIEQRLRPRAPTPTISTKLVTGPTRPTQSMSRRGLRIRFGFTGTGFAHAITGMPEIAPIAGQDDRAERVDVRDRVQREPARLLGGVVTEPERDDAVADLVEDDRDDEAAEEDERLRVDVHGRVQVPASGAATRR